MTYTEQLGAELGAAFAEQREQGSVQQREAQILAHAIITRDPKVKLPMLLANPRIKAWQEANGVTDSHLKDALAKARAGIQAKASEETLRVPPRKRQRSQSPVLAIANGATVKLPGVAQRNRGVVPNRSLDLL